MRILLLTHSFNSLAQRIFVELEAAGHEVSVEFDINDAVTEEAVSLFRPDCLVAPFLKRAIPEAVWRRLPCFIVHPGVKGDRGPSALDWAILNRVPRWGVTVLQAERNMDAGPVWATAEFAMRDASKSSLYRNEVTEAAVAAVLETLERFQSAGFVPERAGRSNWQPQVSQSDRAIAWERDSTEDVLRKIGSADGNPGLRSRLCGRTVYLYDAHRAANLEGRPGQVVATSGPAIAVATSDGAIWIGRLRDAASIHPFKLPATAVLMGSISDVPEIALDSTDGYREIAYEEEGGAGFLHFRFYNGAMGTAASERLLAAYRAALSRPTRVLVLMGGADFWSNGMDLNLIEAAASPADESWRNINAIDDIAEAILRTEDRPVIAALQGNAGAGGVFLARAASEVWLRTGVVLSPHYKDMGNLYGSELWTYSLPRHTSDGTAASIMSGRLPMGSAGALRVGIADRRFGTNAGEFEKEVRSRAIALAGSCDLPRRIAALSEKRVADEAQKPLSLYREEELARMRLNFYGFDPSYHVARYNFVRKQVKSRTPVTLARHRDRRLQSTVRKAS